MTMKIKRNSMFSLASIYYDGRVNLSAESCRRIPCINTYQPAHFE